MNHSASDLARQNFPDELRGFALLGIILVNSPFLGVSAQGLSGVSMTSSMDLAAAIFIVAFAQAKFYLLFSFLFGYSLTFIVRDGSPATKRRFKRRLFGLGFIGVAHVFFLYAGDILFFYALAGWTLLWMSSLKDRVVSLICVAALILWLSLLLIISWSAAERPSGAQEMHQALHAVEAFDTAMKYGDYWTAAKARIVFWPWNLMLISLFNGLAIIAMFALGMLAGRHGSLGNPTRYSRLGQNGILIGFGFGLPLSLLGAWWAVGSSEPIGSFRQTMGEVVVFAAAPLVTWAYLGLLAAARSKWGNVLAIFRPAGRMSLTIYIGESAMMSLLFCAYGVGLFGKLGIAAVGFCSVVVWAILATFAYYYQQRWRMGPLESLLRYWST